MYPEYIGWKYLFNSKIAPDGMIVLKQKQILLNFQKKFLSGLFWIFCQILLKVKFFVAVIQKLFYSAFAIWRNWMQRLPFSILLSLSLVNILGRIRQMVCGCFMRICRQLQHICFISASNHSASYLESPRIKYGLYLYRATRLVTFLLELQRKTITVNSGVEWR